MIIVIIGAQWGDEGKGKVVDLLADRFDNRRMLIASSDQHGDGKIFIEDVQEGIRISTRERSESLA